MRRSTVQVDVAKQASRTHGIAAHVALDLFMQCEAPAMSFGIYIGGIVLVVAGLVYAAAIVHMPVHWIVVGALVLLGSGVLAAVKATRQRDAAG